MASRSGMRLYVTHGVEFTRVANALRVIDKSLPTKFRTALRKAADPLVTKAKEKVRNLPVTGTEHTGLRRRVARGVRVRAAVGKNPRIRIVTIMADPSEAVIPRGLDRPEGWRHPVFGNTDVWVQQPGASWFMETMEEGRDEVTDRVVDVVEEAKNFVAKQGGVI